MITAAEAMVKCLEQENIQVIFGYPGAAICPFYDALTASNIRHILVRQEQNAGHAASGYARLTGRPAVCVATSGPGATNLITAIATAYMDSVPMVAITGQVSSEMLGRDVFQEADITGAVEPFIKHSYLVKDAKSLPRIFKEAFYIAGTGRPGPVLIDVPVDIQKTGIDFSYPESVDIRSYKPSVKGHVGQVKKVIEALAAAKQPVICAGGGVILADAAQELIELAERCDIPVVHTMMGIGVMPSFHRLSFGMLGSHGVEAANYAVNHTDLLILIGARVGDRAVAAPGLLEQRTRIIHIDVDPAEIGKNLGANIPIVGDAKVILRQLLEADIVENHTEWIDRLTEKKEAFMHPAPAQDGRVSPKQFMRMLSAKAAADAVVVADVGQNQIWTCNYFEMKGQTRFLTTGGMGTMGYSVPAAVGAKLAAPQRQTLAICGDGSFQMQMMELGTICQHHVPVKIVIMRNNRLGMVRELQTLQYRDNCTAVFLDGSPDFMTLAEAYGIPAAHVSSMEEAPAAIDAMLQAETPYVMVVEIGEGEPTL
ncbi:MAG TPA: biosynthetic-type acetolactate synthase large subunit [Firmicutes bacterium]|nr:biosynthetic-type acetolactate synthase large subunit [Bacillota bacterium]